MWIPYDQHHSKLPLEIHANECNWYTSLVYHPNLREFTHIYFSRKYQSYNISVVLYVFDYKNISKNNNLHVNLGI